MKRLVVQEECIHGRTGDCDAQTHGLGRYCPGGSEERLDPERTLFLPDKEMLPPPGFNSYAVQDVLDALGDQ